MDIDDFFERVQIIIEHKYDIDDDILCDHLLVIEHLYKLGVSPRQAVEIVAKTIFQTD